MHISRDYFGGQVVDSDRALKMMKESSIINLAGEQAVNIALSNKMAPKEAVRAPARTRAWPTPGGRGCR